MNQREVHSDRVLDALGNQTRRDILALLKKGPQPVGSLAAQLPVSRPAVSKHLHILQAAGLVSHRAEGTRNIFSLNMAGFQEARVYLEQFWDEALANFQQVADAAEEQTG